MSVQIVTPDCRRGAEAPLKSVKFRPAGRFRHFAAAKSAGHGVFAVRMSWQKHPIEKVCEITDFLDKLGPGRMPRAFDKRKVLVADGIFRKIGFVLRPAAQQPADKQKAAEGEHDDLSINGKGRA